MTENSAHAPHNEIQDPIPEEYTFIASAGEGCFGRVYLVEDCTGRRLALKMISKKRLGAHWENEFQSVSTYFKKEIQHPSIAQIYHVASQTDYFYYTMEVADPFMSYTVDGYTPDTLEKRIEYMRFNVMEIADLAESLLDGIQALHQAGLIHGDIKPSNIIYCHGIVKLSDFGLVSGKLNDAHMMGTEGFIAPECLRTNTPIHSGYAMDYYALGMTLYCAFTGNPPESYPEIDSCLLCNPGARKVNRFILGLCERTPRKRIQTYAEALRHVRGIRNWRNTQRRHYLYHTMVWGIIGILTIICAILYIQRKTSGSNSPEFGPQQTDPLIKKSSPTDSEIALIQGGFDFQNNIKFFFGAQGKVSSQTFEKGVLTHIRRGQWKWHNSNVQIHWENNCGDSIFAIDFEKRHVNEIAK